MERKPLDGPSEAADNRAQVRLRGATWERVGVWAAVFLAH